MGSLSADRRGVTEAIAFEPHADYNSVTVAVQSKQDTITLEAGTPYVTKDPNEIAELDAAAHVKRVAKGETKAEAKAEAEKKGSK